MKPTYVTHEKIITDRDRYCYQCNERIDMTCWMVQALTTSGEVHYFHPHHFRDELSLNVKTKKMEVAGTKKITSLPVLPEFKYMSDEELRHGYAQMLEDLRMLAEKDGCVAAAWAINMISHQSEKNEKVIRKLNSLVNGIRDQIKEFIE